MRPSLRKSLLGMPEVPSFEKRGQCGMVLPVMLAYGAILAFQIGGLVEYAAHTHRQVRAQESYLKAFYLAEAATEKAAGQVRLFLQKQGVAPTAGQLAAMAAAPPHVTGGYTYQNAGGQNTFSVAYSGAGWVTKKLTAGTYAGLNGNTRTITLTAAVRNTTGGVPSSVSVTQTIEMQLIPVFQFGVFYQNDLEILPGADMTFTGPVHSNANIYLGSQATTTSLTFDSAITSAGSIYHGRKDSSQNMPGDVWIEDSSGTNQNMKAPDGTWLDSNHASWLMGSQDLWDGNVASSVHGVPALNLPLPTGSQPQVLIDRRVSGESSQIQSQKMDYKAQIRIIDGTVMNQNGTSLELRYCSGGGTLSGSGTCPSGQSVVNPISTTTFYNFREAKTIQSTDINVGKLLSSPAFQTIAGSANGVIVYTSDRRNSGSSSKQDAIRLTNASSLPNKGMTVASENPVYVKGDYNTINKQPAGLIGDAFNILSGAWNDANSTNSNLNNRTATNTNLNVTVLTGNTNTNPSTGQYNGGFENIHRMLENWSNRTLTYSGSVITLFNSRIATGNWVYGGPYYTAPTRSWSFDTALSNPSYSIPGFPSVYAVVKSGWEAN